MKKIILLLTFVFISCNEPKREYYNNGNKAREYFLKEGKYDGVYKEYDEIGQIKVIHIYDIGEKVDSSVYYLNNKMIRVDHYLSCDTIKSLIYDENQTLREEGKSCKNIKAGKWKYYRVDNSLEKVFEFMNVNNKQYTNQGWYFDKKGDTIKEFGNFYTFKFSDKKASKNKPVSLCFKYKPLLATNSDVIICISNKIDENFTNLSKIELDTIHVFDNKLENFKVIFESEGRKNLRGFIKEFYEKNKTKNDSITKAERYLYFDIPVLVTE